VAHVRDDTQIHEALTLLLCNDSFNFGQSKKIVKEKMKDKN